MNPFTIIDPDEAVRYGGSPWQWLGGEQADSWELAPGITCRAGLPAKPDGARGTVIALDPGHAFGNGRHATTRICAWFLGAHLGALPVEERGSLSLLDAGTGTGILAIMAEKLGVRRVVAVDLNPYAVESAAAAIAMNDCTGIDLRRGDIAGLAGTEPFDLITANLVSDVLIENLATLRGLTRPGGTIIASGVSGGSHERVTAAFGEGGLVIAASRWLDGWWGYVLTLGERAER